MTSFGNEILQSSESVPRYNTRKSVASAAKSSGNGLGSLTTGVRSADSTKALQTEARRSDVTTKCDYRPIPMPARPTILVRTVDDEWLELVARFAVLRLRARNQTGPHWISLQCTIDLRINSIGSSNSIGVGDHVEQKMRNGDGAQRDKGRPKQVLI